MLIRKKQVLLLGAALTLAAVSQAGALSTQAQKNGYAMGVQVAKAFQMQKMPLDNAAFLSGYQDVMNGKPLQMNDKVITSTVNALRTDAMNKMRAQMQKQLTTMAAKNSKAGAAFLAKNKKAKGVVTLKSGLQYKIIKQGTGPKPTATDTVTVNYEGTLLNGKVFDSSFKRGKPVSFPVSGVIKGWTQALQLMPQGSTWMLYIPSELAYGKTGNPPIIEPNSTLIFKVNLLKVQKS